jgi:hypothetical protein
MNKYGPLNSGAVPTTCLSSSADEDSTHAIKGRVVGVYLAFDISCASGPTVTITTKSDPPTTILTVTTESDGWYYPRTPIHDPTTGAVIANLKSDGIPIDDFINVEISNAEEGDNVDVWLMLE